MNFVKSYTYIDIVPMLLSKMVQFTSDCEFFPDFDVIGKVTDIKLNNSEIIFYVLVKNKNRTIQIGSNMKNLKFCIC